MKTKKTLALLLAALLALSLLAGCNSPTPSGGETPKPTAAPAGDPTEAPKPAPAGKSDKIMQIGTSQSCSTLDPINGYDYWYTIRYGVGETLMKFGVDMSPSPWLAAEMPTVSADNLTWTVLLRDDVTFSTGEKLTGKKLI